MTARATRQQDRSVTNPAFSSRKLKLGTFQTNLDSGCVMSDLDGRLDITWPNTLGLARLAEEMDFEALVPVARWHGFGGATNPQGRGFEAYTWAAGIAASTAKAGVFATSHISLNHPIVAAKQSTVIDHISGGRYALNIVTGWNQPEIDMFGSPMMGHTERYACAEEWLAIVKRLWTEDDAFDHEGKFYKITRGYLQPKPIQRPHPAVMSAGASERGRHFATKYADLVSHRRPRGMPRARAGLPPAGAGGIRPRGPGLDCRQYRAGRDRAGGARFLPLLRAREGRLGSRQEYDRHVHARHQCPDDSDGAAESLSGGIHCRLGWIPADRHQGADRRWIAGVVASWSRRRSAVLAALRARHARVSGRHLSARAVGGITGLWLNRCRAAGGTASAMTRGATWTLTTTLIFGTRFTASRRDIGTRSIAMAGAAPMNSTCRRA